MHLLTLLLCCAIGLAGCEAIELIDRPSLQPGALTAARARWLLRAPARYRLLIEEQSLGVPCRQEMEISHGQIIAVRQNTCPHLPWTIAELFARIERDQRNADLSLSGCTVAGCACRRFPIFHAAYDPLLGYPSERSVGIRLTPNVFNRDFWAEALRQHQLPDCDFAVNHELLIAQVSAQR